MGCGGEPVRARLSNFADTGERHVACSPALAETRVNVSRAEEPVLSNSAIQRSLRPGVRSRIPCSLMK
ncbi:hypothetical protein AciX8_0306 [Granulicella mallensis MP5ACTX8]|uniref:Uncharacterized protein n=1 Tax=Granulicella mallensis (strain ATCC BAA-1857 / DSM 23137 / MP5ACTX8) TaxID=682795 RepID=G8P0Q3_GRAMM|nr:hypothetical protein AciX8_0306 [Granulicella mallensis MP5ACTX8]